MTSAAPAPTPAPDPAPDPGRGGRWRRWAVAAADALAVLFLVGVQLYFHPRRVLGPAGDDAPGWASPFDRYLAGPDAGLWAAAAEALAGGHLADVDPHRLPTWVMGTAGLMRLTGLDAALAGHLLNHLCGLALPVAVYALGRVLGLGGLSLAAGAMAAMSIPLKFSVVHYGIDAFVATALPLLLLAASQARRSTGVALLAGLLGGAVAIGHLSTLGFPVSGLLLAVALAPPGGRLRTGGAYAAGVALWVMAVYAWYPFLPRSEVLTVFAEGIVQTSQADPSADQAAAHLQAAGAVVQGGLASAPAEAARRTLPLVFPPELPWAAGLTLLWLGLGGPLLSAHPLRDRRAWLSGLRAGLPLGTALLPLLPLAAAHAQDRYLYNLLPLLMLAFFRGVAVLVRAVERLLPASAAGLLTVLAGLALALPQVLAPRAPIDQVLRPRLDHFDQVALVVGDALRAWPPRSYAVCPPPEALAYAGLRACLQSDCPAAATEEAFEACLAEARASCPGEGPLPWVAIDRPDQRRVTAARAAMDSWVVARFPAHSTLQADGQRITIVLVPR